MACSAQIYSGFYVSEPSVHSFHHFKIHQDRDDSGKLKGDLHIRAYNEESYLWEQAAKHIDDPVLYDELVANYAGEEKVISVHMLKFMWDGNEWEYIMLGYIAADKHRHFIVIEEVFSCECKTLRLRFNRFDWVKGHHLALAENEN